MTFLAAALPDPGSPLSIGWVVLILSNLLGTVATIVTVYVQLRRDPPLHREFVSKEDHDEHKADVDKRIVALAKASSESREKIYVKLADHATQLAENTTKTDLTHSQVQKIDSKIDTILQRLPRQS